MLPKNYFIHLHCFTDDWDWAQKWMSEFPNLFIGITNLVTYNSAVETHDVVKRIPLDRLLLETDAPYFVPRRVRYSNIFSKLSYFNSLELKNGNLIDNGRRQNHGDFCLSFCLILPIIFRGFTL